MSGEVVDSISNLHDLIGHYCVPFPLITKVWYFSLSLHLILFIVWEITKFSDSNLTVPVVSSENRFGITICVFFVSFFTCHSVCACLFVCKRVQAHVCVKSEALVAED